MTTTIEPKQKTVLDPVTFEVLKNSFTTSVDLMSEQICAPATHSSFMHVNSPARWLTQRATLLCKAVKMSLCT